MLRLLWTILSLISLGLCEKGGGGGGTESPPGHAEGGGSYGAMMVHSLGRPGTSAPNHPGVHSPSRGQMNHRKPVDMNQPEYKLRNHGPPNIPVNHDDPDNMESHSRREPYDLEHLEERLSVEDSGEGGGGGRLGCGGWCRSGEFLCEGSCTCVPVSWRCDGEPDCVSGEDEIFCSPSTSPQICPPDTHTRCPHTGKCIKKDFICDGADDCGDFSDETHCGLLVNCTETEFECNNGLCIKLSWLCDGENDCRDLSDERNCTMKTECVTEHEFRCGDGTCISLMWRCDGEPDCTDQSDESECPDIDRPDCKPSEFQCGYPRCIHSGYRCDGDDDCGDWSDEEDCPKLMNGACSDSEFKCENGRCVSSRWRCDGERDCESGEDEAHCETAVLQECSPDQFACRMGNCILKKWVCDGVQDCSQGEDEQGCVTPCDPETEFTCPPANSSSSKAIAHCIRKKNVCDDKQDCPHGEDEHLCSKRISCNDSPKTCKQLCVKTHDDKFACDCRPGYTLDEDGESCKDIDECRFKNDPVCSQTCNNTIGSYLCGCYKGYVLRPDGMSCKALGAPPTLLFANRIDIRQVSLDHHKYTAVLKSLPNAIALDYHYKRGLVFWSDVSMDTIKRSRINGTNITDITRWGLDEPSGVAVDWIHDLLFWTDSGTRRVEVSTLDGQIRHVLVSEDLGKPRAIAVHPERAYVFWTDFGTKPKIERCDMDGSNRRNIVTESVQWPNGLCIDFPANRIYWADAKHHVVESAKLDGSERRKVISKGLPHPFGITIFEDSLYWTDWHTKSISTANKATGSGFMTIHSNLHFPMDIRSYHPQRQPDYPNHCGTDNGGCSHLCLPNSLNFQCVCPLGLKLTRNNRTCDTTTDEMLLFARKKDLRLRSLGSGTPGYDVVIPLDGIKSAIALAWDSSTNTIFWTDTEAHSISSANVNGKDQKKIVDNNLEKPTGLSLDWVTNKLYWVDSGTKVIEVSNLDGSMRCLLVWEGLNIPRDITVDPLNAYMYWSDWGGTEEAKIERSGMDGKERSVFVATSLGLPNGLTVDHDTSRLYWTDAKMKTIEFIELSGKGRTTLMSGVANPFGLGVHNTLLLWTDWETNSIHTVDKRTGKNKKDLRSGLSGLMDLTVMEQDKEVVPSKCLADNGGCSHLCLLSPTTQSYSCACPIGIQLEADGRTCQLAPEKWLIIAHRKEIRQVALGLPYLVDVVLPLPQLSAAVAVDVDTLTGDIYWSDTYEDVIKKAHPVDYAVTTVVSNGLDTADGIVIDSIGRKIYWTDAGSNSIQVCSMSDCESYRKVLVWNRLDSPRAITLNYDMGLLFWTDWGSHPRIEQANMDGHNRMTLISKNLQWPNGLAVYKDRLYWTDAKTGTIETAPLSDTGNRTLLLGGLPHPYALVLFGEYIYWTDWSTKSVCRAFKNGTAREEIIGEHEGLMDIRAVYKKDSMPNICGSSNGGCSHLCLRTPNGFSCACPTGILLKNDNKTCESGPGSYLLFTTHTALVRISFDTPELWNVTLPTGGLIKAVALDYHLARRLIFYTDVHFSAVRAVSMTELNRTWTVLSNLSRPDALAVDWLAENLYWLDTGTCLIEVARLDGSMRKVVVSNTQEPRSIALYPEMGYMYWADWGNSPKIEWSYLDGSKRRVIIEGDLGFPNGLTIDTTRKKLYWADALKDRIEMSDFTGRNRMLLVAEANHPFGLTLLGDYVYWADWYAFLIERADADTGREKTKIRGHRQRLMDLKGVDSTKQTGWNPCARENGHCSHLCLYRGSVRGYVCACPDLVSPTSSCSTEPSGRVEDVARQEADVMLSSEQESGGGGEPPEESGDLPESSPVALVITGLVLSLATAAVISVLVYICHRKRRRQKKYMYTGGRSVLTFSNPNYNVSTSNIEAVEREEKRPSIWRKFRFEKTQERVFAVHMDSSDKSTSGEVVSLIPVPASPCPSSPTPTNLQPSTSNC